jgi:BlaI family transcriptional regulator, penicillinase repressor
MSNRKSSTFTEVELEFMQILWDQDEMNTDDIQKMLNKQDRNLTDGTIRKVLSILMEKGHVERRREGRSFFYKVKTVKEHAKRNIVSDMLKRAFSGSASSLVAALLDSNEVDDEDIEKIKVMIEKREQEAQE